MFWKLSNDLLSILIKANQLKEGEFLQNLSNHGNILFWGDLFKMINNYGVSKINHSKLIMLIPLFFIFMPRPNIEGIQFLTYPSIVVVITLLTLNLTKDIKVNKDLFLLLSFMFVLTLEMLFSMFIFSNLTIDNLGKQILFSSVLYFGYLITNDMGIDKIKNSLKKVAYIVIFLQSIVGLTQLFGIDVFASLYSMEKTRALGGIVRIAGTMGNPNIFAWILIQMSVILWLFERKIFKKLFWTAIAIIFVFFSGSRSMLLIFPFVLLFIEIVTKRKTFVFYLLKVPMYGMLLVGTYRFAIWFLTDFGANFPYIRQLLLVFESGDLSSINSFNYRLYMWDRSLSQLTTNLHWVFGSGGAIGHADNDYVFAISNFGITYFVIQLLMYLVIVYFFIKLKDRKFKTLGLQYIVFSLIISYQADTLSGWNYPIFIMFYTGIAVSILANKNVPKVIQKPIKKKRKRYRIVWSK